MWSCTLALFRDFRNIIMLQCPWRLLMGKPQRSIRLSGGARRVLGREVVRVTLNPVLLSLSEPYVSWSGGPSSGKRLTPGDLVVRARSRFPRLPLSWAVEGYIALLVSGADEALVPLAVAPYDEVPENVRRFRALTPAEKIRVGERWRRELRAVQGAR
jgi:hypothetical protein